MQRHALQRLGRKLNFAWAELDNVEQKVNIYLSAEEAVKHGIADIIVWGKTMSDLKKILKEVYAKKKLNITPKLLMEILFKSIISK